MHAIYHYTVDSFGDYAALGNVVMVRSHFRFQLLLCCSLLFVSRSFKVRNSHVGGRHLIDFGLHLSLLASDSSQRWS